MKILNRNRYTEHMQKLSIILVVPSHDYRKLTQYFIVSERQDCLLMTQLIHGASLGLVSHQK